MNLPEQDNNGLEQNNATEPEQGVAQAVEAGSPAVAPQESGNGTSAHEEIEAVPEQSTEAAPPQEIVEEAELIDNPAVNTGQSGAQSLLSTIVIALFVITFVVQAFQIPSQSMEKTLLIGDYLLVDKLHFGHGGPMSWLLPYRDIKRGDIVVFHYPVDPSQHFVKRVIGVPGDRIRLRDKQVYVNDFPLPETYAIHVFRNYDGYRDNFPDEPDNSGQVNSNWRVEMPRHIRHGELIVAPGEYFVMGDNRENSLDSRYWGFVPRQNIEGRPLIIYLSLRDRSEPDPTRTSATSVGPGNLLTHMFDFARWKRMFHLVR
jgi:signal peptidase I